ncbi:M20/M25/M40 family metallo-hydrolase [Clostridium sp. AM58-1XD]|uniref:M20/M25/M40 family metallo-hydrolase n=1 Tax=Clostridium sp. AM58-1XD TaxID=2292307 RepID=UPI000E4FDFAD|nr:M20/M25/M40 family metallo-hydrolase [Clostridium sp. AM58-1XD]RGZ01547.1 M20/M25/M40 family metallo-hydrolase [Clostridium sp. AM58-1XD]
MNEKRLLETFFDYVQINSETRNEKEMCDRVMKDLKELGVRVDCDEIGDKFGSNGYNIYAYLDGDESLEPVMLSAHLDTVVPGNAIEPYIEDGVIRSKGDSMILAADDKAGISGIMEALRTVKEQGIKTRPVEVFFSVGEECGLHGAKNADYSKLKSKMGVVMDMNGDIGTTCYTCPGQTNFTFEIFGKAAHAGIAPQNGISAILAAAEGIANMKLLRVDEETTANIGTFEAVGPTNIVAPYAKVIAEARSTDMAKLEEQGNQMIGAMQAACDKYGAELKYATSRAYNPYKVTPEDKVCVLLEKCYKTLGCPVHYVPSGGGCDSNIHNEHGIQSVGIGIGMDSAHTSKESITVDQLNKTALLALELMKA